LGTPQHEANCREICDGKGETLKKKFLHSVLGMSAVAALALTGCSANAGGSSNADAQGEIVIGEFAGWGESIVTSALWKIVLEEE
jgi:ABC-type proline/glycine betaine transport system substrate-binding protein